MIASQASPSKTRDRPPPAMALPSGGVSATSSAFSSRSPDAPRSTRGSRTSASRPIRSDGHRLGHGQGSAPVSASPSPSPALKSALKGPAGYGADVARSSTKFFLADAVGSPFA